MLAPLLLVWLGPPTDPPRPPPVTATDERVIYEPPRSDDVLEPIEIIPPAQPTLPPAPAEPPAAEPPPAPARAPLPPPPPPPTGNGRLVGSGFAMALGLAALSVVPIELSRNEGNPSYVAATFIPLGAAGIGIGAFMLRRGLKARANFKAWVAYAETPPRPSGEGLLVAGVISSVIGGVALVGAGVAAREAPPGPVVPITFAVGGAFVATGIGTLTAGLLRRGRYHSWRASFTSAAPPIIVPLRAGVGVAWSLRF
jgi:hypothetical protein